MTSPRLILVGGFLGAGKTTLLLATAERLAARGVKVGLVTNDQAAGLVDTVLADDHAIPVTEVSGGCFCCRFPDLLRSLQRLQTAVAPDIILAEPVGSCTDLTATVLRPLAHDFGQHYILAPLTVVIAADHSLADFSGQVAYLYERQTAEAELLLLNKCDLLSPEQIQNRTHKFAADYPAAQVFPISARYGAGVEAWLDVAMSRTSQYPIDLALDYQTYAEAEAELGWCNASGVVAAAVPVPLDQWMEALLQGLGMDFQKHSLAVAHLKVHLASGQHSAKASLTAGQGPISWDIHPGDACVPGLNFVLNARVAAAPERLEHMIRGHLAQRAQEYAAQCRITHLECFRPAPPKPTHRMSI